MNERDRLVKIIESEGLNAKQFSQEIGVSAGTISNIIGGRNKPSLDVLQAVLRRFRTINCDWLIMGVGNMYLSENERTESVLPSQPVDTILSQDDLPSNQSSLPIEKIPMSAGRTVEKILIFYSDGTFEER